METLLSVEDLEVHFPIKKGVLSRVAGYVYAVDGVSISLGKGETLGIVGESGCGKTTTGLAVLRLIEPTAGTIHLDGEDVLQLAAYGSPPGEENVVELNNVVTALPGENRSSSPNTLLAFSRALRLSLGHERISAIVPRESR